MERGKLMYKYIFKIEMLLNLLEVKTKNDYYAQVNCPFCNDTKGKMRLDFEKNVFRCPKCSTSGGTITLFSILNGVSWNEAYIDLKTYTIKDNTLYTTSRKQKKIHRAELLSDEEIDRTYRAMLDFCTLTNKHKNNLLYRGLSERGINRIGYKSVPVNKIKELVLHLDSLGCGLIGVAGFYRSSDGRIFANISKNSEGIIIPIKNDIGQITALQYRLDNPYNDSRYLFFSSGVKNEGCSFKNSTHYELNAQNSESVIVTEGALKANVANCLSYLKDKEIRNYVGLVSATTSSVYDELFTVLKKKKIKVIYEAFDMDKLTNENVLKGVKNFTESAKENGFIVNQCTWCSQFKGIDDYLLYKNVNRA